MNIRDKKWIGYALLVLAILVAGYLGVCYPLPEMPEGAGAQAVSATRFRSIQVDHDANVDGASTSADLTCSGTVSAEQLTTTDDLTVTDAAAVSGALDVDGATTLNSTLDVDGNLTSGTGAITATDNILVDGAADAIQLTVQGYTTQTSSLLVLEQSDGTDKLTVSNDGNADIAGTLQYGANNLYALGHASSGQQAVYGTSTITGTATAAHGLTTVTFALCTLGEDPTSGAGDGAMCTVTVSGNVVTVKVWQDDFVTAATEANVDVHWLVIGAP